MSLTPYEHDLLAGLLSRPPGNWGNINTVRQITDGMIQVSCEGHGGIGITAERNEKIPQSQRAIDGWYEEDIGWSLPVQVFADEVVAALGEAMGRAAVSEAASTIRNWMPQTWTELTGEKLDASSSNAIREAEFKQKHALDWTVRSAFGYSEGSFQGVPKGMVGYIAYQNAKVDRYGNPRETRGFLVTTEEAAAVRQRGHIIDMVSAQPVPVNSLGFGACLSDYTNLGDAVRPDTTAYCWQPPDESQLQIRLNDGKGIDLVSTRSHSDWGRLLAYPDFESDDKLWYFATAHAMMAGAINGLPQSTIETTHIYMLSAIMPAAAMLLKGSQAQPAVDDTPSPD